MLFISLTTSTHAQWNLQSPVPTGLHLNSAYFITPAHGFIVGVNHLLLETKDGGATWVTRMSGAYGTDPLYSISFADSLTGFIVGNSTSVQKDILRTTDGGSTWSVMNNFPLGGSWNLIDFISPTKIFFGSNGACAYSSNGGNTYQLKSGYPNCPVMYGMDFRDEQVGLVAGNMNSAEGIFKTTNGGATWSKKSSVATNDVLWWTNTNALAASGTSIYRSTNQGDTWSVYATGINTGLLELERIDKLTIAGVSAKGDIWRSADAGLTWTQVFDGPGDLPVTWSLHFSDAKHGWLVGQSGFIFKSNDGGLTWQQVNSGSGVQVYDMAFTSSTFGMAAGNNGYVFKTVDGGNFWSVQKLEVTGQIFGRDESLHAISMVDNNFAVVAGPGGTVFRTTDGGVSWKNIGYPKLPDAFWIEDVKFIDHNIGWLVGLDQDLGHAKSVYKTTDGGDTWTLGLEQNSYFFATDFTDAKHGWIATIGNLYFRTIDSGKTWIPGNYPPYFTSPTVSDIDFADQNNGWAVGWDGFVAHSTNGGVSWTLQDLGTTEEHFFSIYVVNASEAWITGRKASLPAYDGVVYHTTNGGATWSKEISSPEPYWGYAIAGSGGNVWIGGFEGHIYKRADSSCVKPKATITPSGTVYMCSGDQVLLTANSGANLSYQWMRNGVNITGATGNTYTATAAGRYTVKVTKTTTNCSKVSAATTIKITCTSLDNSKSVALTTVQVYPNPSSRSFTLRLNKESNYTVQVYDMLGRMFEEYKSVNSSLSFGDKLSEGAYLVKITAPSGQVETIKVIKVKE
jgi:photosystem II stability/assembly factor-like uncharacterized protein